MTPNAKLDALIARIEGGEKLTRKIDAEIAAETGWTFMPAWALSGPYWLNPEGIQADPPNWHASFDAIMSLARNLEEASTLLYEGDKISYQIYKKSKLGGPQPFNPEPILRAILVAALEARRI